MTTLYEELKSRAPEWEEYTKHEFVEKLGDGTLPLEAFQDYLVQDYLFLVHFARAHALAAFKSRRLSEIEAVSTAMSGIIDETKLHRKLTAEWGISEDELDRAPAAGDHSRGGTPVLVHLQTGSTASYLSTQRIRQATRALPQEPGIHWQPLGRAQHELQGIGARGTGGAQSALGRPRSTTKESGDSVG